MREYTVLPEGDNLKIGVLGANGQIGTELCILLRKAGAEVIPVVRNEIGAAFLRHSKFECRVAEVASPDGAKNALRGIDVVVVSAYEMDIWGTSRKSFAANRAIIRNSVEFSSPGAVIIYFSTIRAFSGRVDEKTPMLGIPKSYDFEKRSLERILVRECMAGNRRGYALRLGHVFGTDTSKARNITQAIVGRKEVDVQVEPERLSNAVHIQTIMQAILACAKKNQAGGVYTLVNVPQWTWREVLEYYNAGSKINFVCREMPKKNLFSGILLSLLPLLKTLKSVYFFARIFLPEEIDVLVKVKSNLYNVRKEIDSIEVAEKPFCTHEFFYRPAPGPFLNGLTETRKLLEKYPPENSLRVKD